MSQHTDAHNCLSTHLSDTWGAFSLAVRNRTTILAQVFLRTSVSILLGKHLGMEFLGQRVDKCPTLYETSGLFSKEGSAGSPALASSVLDEKARFQGSGKASAAGAFRGEPVPHPESGTQD